MKRFIVTFSLLVFLLVLTLVAFFPQVSEAIPAYARKYEVTCSTCHIAWPLLNKTGRDFKENGYKFITDENEDQVVSEFLRWDKSFPITAVITSRPYDEKKSGDRKIRALHEVELML